MLVGCKGRVKATGFRSMEAALMKVSRAMAELFSEGLQVFQAADEDVDHLVFALKAAFGDEGGGAAGWELVLFPRV